VTRAESQILSASMQYMYITSHPPESCKCGHHRHPSLIAHTSLDPVFIHRSFNVGADPVIA